MPPTLSRQQLEALSAQRQQALMQDPNTQSASINPIELGMLQKLLNFLRGGGDGAPEMPGANYPVVAAARPQVGAAGMGGNYPVVKESALSMAILPQAAGRRTTDIELSPASSVDTASSNARQVKSAAKPRTVRSATKKAEHATAQMAMDLPMMQDFTPTGTAIEDAMPEPEPLDARSLALIQELAAGPESTAVPMAQKRNALLRALTLGLRG